MPAQGLGAFAQDIGLASSDSQNNEVLGQMVNPVQSNYIDSTAKGLGQQASAIGEGGRNVQMDYSGAQPGQNAQNDALGLSGQLARGQGPSLSRANMNLGLSQGASNLQASQAGFGAQGGLGERNMMNAMAGMQAQAAGQGAVAGAAEQIGNIQNYGALGSAARGQGLTQAGMSAANGHQNTADALSGLSLAHGIGQDTVGNSRAYDAALMSQGNDRAAVMNGQNVATAAAGGKVLDTGMKIASAAAGAM